MMFHPLKSFRNGHRYFSVSDVRACIATPHVAIADQSGATPDQTDDGVLFVDFTRKPTWDDQDHLVIPLRDTEGRTTATIAAGPEAVWVITRLFNVCNLDDIKVAP